HTMDALRDSADVPRCVVSYDDLLKDWRGTTLTIARRLQVRWPRWSPTAEAAIDDFLCDRERPPLVANDAWVNLPDPVEWVARAYPLVLAMTSAEVSHSLPDELTLLASQFDAASGAFAPLIQEQQEKATAERNAAREFEARLAAAEARLRRDERVIERLQSDLRQTQNNLNETQNYLRATQSDLRETRSNLEVLLTSRSWRLTAPLRQGLRFLSRLREIWLPRTAAPGDAEERHSNH